MIEGVVRSMAEIIAKYWRESGIGRGTSRLGKFISKGWTGSAIGAYISDEKSDTVTDSAIVGKALNMSQHVVDINKDGVLSKSVDNSLILGIFHNILMLFLTVDARFLGAMLLPIGIGLLFTASNPILGIMSTLAAMLLIILKNSLISFASGSIIAKIGEAFVGEKINFDYFKELHRNTKNPFIYGIILGIIATIATFFIPAKFVAIGIIVAIGAGLVLYKSVLGIFAIVFLSPFAPTMVCAAMAIWTLISFIINVILGRESLKKLKSVEIAIIILAAIMAFYAATSLARTSSVKVWLIYAAFMSTYFVIINTIKSRRHLYLTVATFLAAGLLVALYGVYQKYFGNIEGTTWLDMDMFGDIGSRIYSTFGNPNVLGEYLLLVIPIAAAAMWTKKGVWTKLLYLGIFGIACICMILTQSRGCWLALIVSAFVFIMLVERKFMILFLIGLIAAPFVLPQSIIERFMSIGNTADSSTSYRVYIWLGTLNMLKDFGIYGIGLGSEAYNKIYPFYSYSNIVAPHAHNIYLQFLCETGIAGLSTFLAVIALTCRKILTAFRRSSKSFEGVLGAALISALVGFMLQGMFDYIWYNYRVVLIFWIIIALSSVTAHLAKSEVRGK